MKEARLRITHRDDEVSEVQTCGIRVSSGMRTGNLILQKVIFPAIQHSNYPRLPDWYQLNTR